MVLDSRELIHKSMSVLPLLLLLCLYVYSCFSSLELFTLYLAPCVFPSTTPGSLSLLKKSIPTPWCYHHHIGDGVFLGEMLVFDLWRTAKETSFEFFTKMAQIVSSTSAGALCHTSVVIRRTTRTLAAVLLKKFSHYQPLKVFIGFPLCSHGKSNVWEDVL